MALGSFAHLLRPGLTVDQATDIFWVTFKEQTADAFLLDRGWTLADYADWFVDAVDRLLLR
ncbi:hypothetical protein ACIBQ1_27935 [Nonomuraea sp. NPDC050153]|uniref:hypothetical protein n=1 Tax=Nonomuraea sp. NPDC050153 TaxID=3364359 RepID=UPI0037B220C4